MHPVKKYSGLDLRNSPVVVLSNNDGCVIAQSREAKALGIRMAGPWFEVEERAREIGAVAFSSNYELYANMSNRFMATLSQFSPRQEVYSIDECFLDLTGIKRDLVAYGHEIKETVTSWTDCPYASASATAKRWPSLPTTTPRCSPN
jgi:DNA polymerase V